MTVVAGAALVAVVAIAAVPDSLDDDALWNVAAEVCLSLLLLLSLWPK